MSTPTNSVNASGVLGSINPGSATASGHDTSGGGVATSRSTPYVLLAPDLVIRAQIFDPDYNWPAGLVLDRGKSNWHEWDRRLHPIVDQRGFRRYLNGTLPCPDATVHPVAANNWTISDIALRGFILEHISDHDYDTAIIHPTSHGVYKALRDSHQNLTPFEQLKVMKELFSIQFTPDVPLTRTFDRISKLHARFIEIMDKLNDDQLLCLFILNAFEHYPGLQATVYHMMANPLTTSEDIKSRLLREEKMFLDNGGSDSLAAVPSKSTRPICSNCERAGHHTRYCVAAGGAMAGRTIEEARAAARNARRRGRSLART